MNKQQATEIIEREPVGGAQFYSPVRDRFYNHICGEWYRFGAKWIECIPLRSTIEKMIPMHEILEIALGED